MFLSGQTDAAKNSSSPVNLRPEFHGKLFVPIWHNTEVVKRNKGKLKQKQKVTSGQAKP